MKKKLVILSILCLLTLAISSKSYSADTFKVIRIMRSCGPVSGGGMT